MFRSSFEGYVYKILDFYDERLTTIMVSPTQIQFFLCVYYYCLQKYMFEFADPSQKCFYFLPPILYKRTPFPFGPILHVIQAKRLKIIQDKLGFDYYPPWAIKRHSGKI